MPSEIGICNIALSLIGASSIRSFEDNNKRARMCESLYGYARNTILEQYDWTFARRVKLLRILEDDPIGVKYAYAIPSDCQAPQNISAQGSGNISTRTSWEVSGDSIWTSTVAPVLSYTVKLPPVGSFTASFVSAVATLLAAIIAPSIMGADTDVPRLENNSKIALAKAMDSDANIGSDYIHPDMDANNDSFVDPEGSQLLAGSDWLVGGS